MGKLRWGNTPVTVLTDLRVYGINGLMFKKSRAINPPVIRAINRPAESSGTLKRAVCEKHR